MAQLGRSFLEFFAGGGMVRLGLGDDWRCMFANDVDPGKCAAYAANFAGCGPHCADIAELTVADLPSRRADLAWASFPCQDLSLAGQRLGLAAPRSGLFREFMRLIAELSAKHRAPRTIVIENVMGLLTSGGGSDFRAVVGALREQGYAVGALVIDARAFVPQSRPRLFVFGFSGETCTAQTKAEIPISTHKALRAAVEALPRELRDAWRWIDAPPLPVRNTMLSDILEPDAPFDPPERTGQLLTLLSDRGRAEIGNLQSGVQAVGAAFRRIRIEKGVRVQRLEVRFDGLAGCLRTPSGGSSRQIIVDVRDGRVRSRRVTGREAARLMGLPDDYRLPAHETAALKLCGDGVVAPVVSWIAQTILEPALDEGSRAA